MQSASFKNIETSHKSCSSEQIQIEKLITCPLSGKVMKKPVVLKQNGYTYERDELEKLNYTIEKIHPKTKKIAGDFVPNRILKNIIEIINTDEDWENKKEKILMEIEDPISLDTITEGVMFTSSGNFISKESLAEMSKSIGVFDPLNNSRKNNNYINNFTLENIGRVLTDQPINQVAPRVGLSIAHEWQKLKNFIDDLQKSLPKHWQKYFSFQINLEQKKLYIPPSIRDDDDKSKSLKAIQVYLVDSFKKIYSFNLIADVAIQQIVPLLREAIKMSDKKQRFSFFKSNVSKGLKKTIEEMKVGTLEKQNNQNVLMV